MARLLTRAIFNAGMITLWMMAFASAQEQPGTDAETLGLRGVAAEPAPAARQAGLRLGSFQIDPSLEIGVSHKSGETNKTLGAKVVVQSQWNRNDLRLETKFDTASRRGLNVEQWTAAAVLNGRLDITARLAATGELRYSMTADEEEQDQTNYGATAAVLVTPGPLEVKLRGSLDYQMVGDPVAGSESGNDYRETAAELRLAYDRGAILAPFVQAVLTDRKTGTVTGFDGDATLWELRGGVQIDRGEKFSGEVSAGIGQIRTRDSRRDTLNGLLWAASLTWSPVRLTTITLDASGGLQFSETTDLTDSTMTNGIRNTRIALRAERNFNYRLDGFARASYSYGSYSGIDRADQTMLFETGLTYALTPQSSLFASFTHERSRSSGADQAEDDERSNGVAVRLQVRR
uniref:outer membrane beta-barrel protein n=1 Tax=Pararhizobium sp. IMCC3301 TaxID=3067904 RepID=UPI002740642A|nr:outer membrane beta-barrel protein [Pararhizobium sp. IMCC3301]